MNIDVQKFAPPLSVVVIAVYLGWPPPAPMDLGEDIVRAKSVRWRLSDLEVPSLPSMETANPFAAVLITTEPEPTQVSTAPEASQTMLPEAPTELQIKDGLSLGGIARTDEHQWAIVNNRVCRIGERVPVDGIDDLFAQVTAIRPDHVVVKVGAVSLKIRQLDRQERLAKAQRGRNRQANDQQLQHQHAVSASTESVRHRPPTTSEGQDEKDEGSETSGTDFERSSEGPKEPFVDRSQEAADQTFRSGWGNNIHKYVAIQHVKCSVRATIT